MIPPEVLHRKALFSLLYKIDQDLAERMRARRCPFAGVLCIALIICASLGVGPLILPRLSNCVSACVAGGGLPAPRAAALCAFLGSQGLLGVCGDFDQRHPPRSTCCGHLAAAKIAFYQYDAAGNLTQVTDVNGQVTTYTYDGRNRRLSSTRNGITESQTYTAVGELKSATDALGRTLDYTYNSAGFLEKIVDPGGDYLFYGYNEYGRRIEESIYAAGGLHTFYRGTDYGTAATNPAISAGKPYKSLYYSPDGMSLLDTTYAYDSSGNLTGSTDANANQTGYQYDAFNHLKQVTQPEAATTAYAYDRHGNLASVTDAEGHITTYIYDDMDRLIKTVSPDAGVTRYSYDASGNLRFKVQNGQVVEYRYDVLGRLTAIIYSDPTQNVALTYDSGSGSNMIGRLASLSDPSGSTQYSYDAQGRLVTETKTIADVSYTTGYGYDSAGNLRSITYPTGQTIEYQPDAADPAKVAAVILNPLGENVSLASAIAYLPFGPVSTMMLGNHVNVSKTYDLNYQLLQLYQANGSTVMDRTYNLDNVGNITAIADNLNSGRSQSFSYDNLYRLTGATGSYGTLSFTYDKVGNRLSRTQDSQQDAYNYYSGSNRLQAIVGQHAELFKYDADGNVTQRIPGASNPTPTITDPADYIYNSSGQRIKKVNSASKVFHYDLAGQLIAETDTAGNMLKVYVWFNGQPLAQIAADGSVYYYHNDHLGTPQRMTDQAATVVWDADYLPFGQAHVTISTVGNNLRFAGQYFDSETGLHYNWNRYYDPKIGRYLRADPTQFKFPDELKIPYLSPLFIYNPQDFNAYIYVLNNAINLVDPLGLCPPSFTKRIRASYSNDYGAAATGYVEISCDLYSSEQIRIPCTNECKEVCTYRNCRRRLIRGRTQFDWEKLGERTYFFKCK